MISGIADLITVEYFLFVFLERAIYGKNIDVERNEDHFSRRMASYY